MKCKRKLKSIGIQFFADGEEGNTELSMEQFVTELGGTPPGAETQTEENPPEGGTSDTEGASTDGGGDNTPPAEDNQQNNQEPQNKDKSGYAFAQMRVENNKFKAMLKNIGGLVGIADVKDDTALMQALEQKVLENQAKTQNIPVELLQRLQNLEAMEETYRQTQLRQTALIGFQRVKDTYGLTDAELNAFADKLVAQGTNPFETQMDLVQAYKMENYDMLMAKAVEEAVRKEQERAANASKHGTTPGSKQGQGEPQMDKVSTARELEKWFAQQ